MSPWRLFRWLRWCKGITQKHFYTQKLLHTQELLHRGAFTHRGVYTQVKPKTDWKKTEKKTHVHWQLLIAVKYNITPDEMGMDQYLLIPFLGGWTSIYQLFWCSPGVQGFDTLPNICGIFVDIGGKRRHGVEMSCARAVAISMASSSCMMPCFGPETAWGITLWRVMALKSWLNGMENGGFCRSFLWFYCILLMVFKYILLIVWIVAELIVWKKNGWKFWNKKKTSVYYCVCVHEQADQLWYRGTQRFAAKVEY